MRALLGVYNRPAAVTFVGLCLSVGVTWLTFAGQFELAVLCLLYAGVCDLFDGAVARPTPLTEQEQAFGVELDSIVDMASFGIAPILLGLASGLQGLVGYSVAALYAVAAAQRLAHFNTQGLERRGDAAYYTGLPVTYAALVFPVVFVLRLWLPVEVFSVLLTAVFALMALLFLSRIPVRKPVGHAYWMILTVCLGLTACWLSAYVGRGGS